LCRLGLNIELRKGTITLLEPFNLCTEGKPITVEQARMLVGGPSRV
jgi:hypothetical protein